MSPTHNPRVSHKAEVPGSFILNWHSSANRSARPLVRRPMTACQRCRTAKVKCPGDGQHGCNRCTTRGLVCRYTQPAPSPGPAVRRPMSRSSSRGPDRNTQEEVQMDFGADPASYEPALGTSSTACSEGSEHMDWGAVDPAIDWTFSSLTHQTGLDDPSRANATLATSSNTSTGTPNSTYIPDQAFLWSQGLLPLMNSTTAADLSWQDQLGSVSCQCRAGLALLIPNARAALQEKRLDDVFKVASDTIGQCQGIIDCKGCRVNCTDLICMMTVFQEADPCFEFITKGHSHLAVIVSMGSYQLIVGEHDTKCWRRMLLMDLLRRANELLNSISARGQAMLKELVPSCRLGRVNIEYLEAVVGNSRDNFQKIMEGLDGEEQKDDLQRR